MIFLNWEMHFHYLQLADSWESKGSNSSSLLSLSKIYTFNLRWKTTKLWTSSSQIFKGDPGTRKDHSQSPSTCLNANRLMLAHNQTHTWHLDHFSMSTCPPGPSRTTRTPLPTLQSMYHCSSPGSISCRNIKCLTTRLLFWQIISVQFIYHVYRITFWIYSGQTEMVTQLTILI